MKIAGFNKTTLLDYPGRLSCTVFLGGCNFRCPFCHNKDIVLGNDGACSSKADILSFLEKRRGILTGVCITGGEPTLNRDLPDFIAQIRRLGYKVKLDTNGSNPKMLAQLIGERLIDYCAMDIKNCPQKYDTSVSFEASGTPAIYSLTDIDESLQILLSQPCGGAGAFSYELRTTLVKELHDEADLMEICRWIKSANAYYLQSYVESDGVFCKGFHAHDSDTLAHFEALCRGFIPNTHLRGV
ncbi:MAG: anaerobic ribonucleoside-triphosphate reductase activating protein [Lachnospiraceae bacterium]|nr:anaerobic ribonucleoside-triphosphate reductase activating protein [Lachnospiraceae bacterium]